MNLKQVKKTFNQYINQYDNQSDLGFRLKVVHTMHVVENAKEIAIQMNLDEEDIMLVQLIAYLHDIGRFDELKRLKKFDSVGNDHALVASNILFDHNLIRDFIVETKYDDIIKKAIENHNKFKIEPNLSEKELLHAKIIRDADKLDNFRVKKEEPIEAIFPGKIKTIDELNQSFISKKVFESIQKEECVDIHDRIYPLYYWICILAFVFDINFIQTLKMIQKQNYINILIDRFEYKNRETKRTMEKIRIIINEYIDRRLKENK